MALKLLHNEDMMALYYESLLGLEDHRSTLEDGDNVVKGEHFAASFGLEDLLAKFIEEGRNNVESRDSRGQTPLFFAVARGWDKLVKLFLNSRASLHAVDDLDRPSLQAAINARHNSRLAMVDLLLNNNADIEARNSGGKTPLSSAVGLTDRAMVMHLLNRGAKIESQDIHSSGPLAKTAELGCVKIPELLLNNGAAIEAEYKRKSRPLHGASAFGRYEMCKLLFERGANIETRNNGLETPLHIACDPSSFGVWLRNPEHLRQVVELVSTGALTWKLETQ